MTTELADIMIHIDETLDHSILETIRDGIIQYEGVGSASFHDETPHLMIVLYNPEKMDSHRLLEIVLGMGFHAELVGLYERCNFWNRSLLLGNYTEYRASINSRVT